MRRHTSLTARVMVVALVVITLGLILLISGSSPRIAVADDQRDTVHTVDRRSGTPLAFAVTQSTVTPIPPGGSGSQEPQAVTAEIGHPQQYPEGSKPPSTEPLTLKPSVPVVPAPSTQDDVKPPQSEAPPPYETTGWTTIMTEGFEGAFPSDLWSVFDNNGTSYGEYYWDDDDYLAHTDSWGAWAANGGADGVDPEYYYYPDNMDSWMVYGPFDLSSATGAELQFYYWNNSELNYDYFQWLASGDGTNFSGYQVSGYSGGWVYENFDLSSWIGDSSVWIGFRFVSDGSNVSDGPFVDDIILQQSTSTKTSTRFRDDIFTDNAGKIGVPILLEAKLEEDIWPIYNDIVGATVHFDIYYSGSWHEIPDDGVESTSFVTDWDGKARVYYTPPKGFALGTYSIRARYDGSASYNPTQLTRALTVGRLQWLFLYYMSNAGNLEGGCEAKFRAIAQEASNSNYQAYVLWDHVSSEDRVFRMKNNSDWNNGYTRNFDYWTATNIGLGTAEMDTGDVNTLSVYP